MGKSPGVIGLAAAGVLWAGGCVSSPWSASRPANGEAAPPSVGPSAAEFPAPLEAPAGQRDAQAMQAVMAELQQLGALDPAAQEKLMEDMRQTDPSLWPLVLQQFRAAVAYRRRAEQQEMEAAGPGQVGEVAGPRRTASPSVPPTGRPDRPFVPEPRFASDAAQPLAPQGNTERTNHIGPSQAPGVAAPVWGNSFAGSGLRSRQHADGSDPADRRWADRRPVDAAGGIANVSYDRAGADDWQVHLASATRALESETRRTPETAREVAQHAQLRLLYLLAGRRDAAVRPIPSVAPATSEFWSQELFGLATWLDAERTPDAAIRAAETKRILSEALTRLSESAPLVVRNLAFCTDIQSYGCIKQLPKYEFTADQEVLMYAEVENSAAEPTPKGFYTSLRSSYRIFDARGQQVVSQDFKKPTEDYCQNQRRDFFIGYRFRLPKRIYPGKHTLRLEIEDLKGRKFGQASIELTIKDDGG